MANYSEIGYNGDGFYMKFVVEKITKEIRSN